jgi:hypothetical protein
MKDNFSVADGNQQIIRDPSHGSLTKWREVRDWRSERTVGCACRGPMACFDLLECDGAYIICANGKMILSCASKRIAKVTMYEARRLLLMDGTALALHFEDARRAAHGENAANSEQN